MEEDQLLDEQQEKNIDEEEKEIEKVFEEIKEEKQPKKTVKEEISEFFGELFGTKKKEEVKEEPKTELSEEDLFAKLGLNKDDLEYIKNKREEEAQKEIGIYVESKLKEKPYKLPSTKFQSKEEFDNTIKLIESVLEINNFIKKSDVKPKIDTGSNKGETKVNWEEEYNALIRQGKYTAAQELMRKYK